MKTIYDLVTLALFAGLVILFLQRSTAEVPQDKMYHYAPPAIGCAVANYVGNHGEGVLAWVIILAVLTYILYVLKPFSHKP
ncbi:MAG: XrtV sorting system accessory protein [Caulobacteraceae bacterium]